MNRYLYLIRHAQASENSAGQTDLQRELTPKGKSDAISLGQYLNPQKNKFDMVLCSPAVRTLTTAKLVFGNKNISVKQELYHANNLMMLNLARQTSNEFSHLVLVAHNPTISTFANAIDKEYLESLSPCTLVVLEFIDKNWEEINFGIGKVQLIKQPPIS
jgi:phosphohistidine phosphatase